MKFKFTFFITLLILLSSFYGCKKAGDSRKSGFTYKGTFYDAQLLGLYTYTSGTYDFRIRISSGEWDENSNSLIGNYSVFKLKTVNIVDGNMIGLGQYNHSSSSSQPGTIYGGYESTCINYSSAVGCEVSPNIVGGNLKVDKEGNDYILDYSLTLSNGEVVEGYYKGPIDYITSD